MSRSWFGVRFGPRLIDSRVAEVRAPATEAFQPIERIGGRAGWYYGDWLWQVRGAIDLVVGGVGMRRGRRDPNRLRVGDTLDCWRVEAIEPHRRLRLAAEMRLPGRAWLEFEVTDSPHGPTAGSRIRQTAEFDPIGILGRAYWYAVYPLHKLMFAGMLRQIATRAESARGSAREPPGSRSAVAQLVGLMACLVVCLAAAAVGGMLTASSVPGWYQTLRKPAWTPADWVFGPVWLALYLMMGVASWLVWRRSDSSSTRGALILFGIQLGLNVAWSGCFFALRNPGLALADLSVLLVAIAATTATFRRISPLAAALMVPYLAWSTFAAVLNVAIWWLNS
jgi:tryptophan-rich sensory protein